MVRAKQEKEMGIAMKKIQSPTELRINLDKFDVPASYLKLGKKIVLNISGEIKSVHQDEYGKSCCIEVSEMETED